MLWGKIKIPLIHIKLEIINSQIIKKIINAGNKPLTAKDHKKSYTNKTRIIAGKISHPRKNLYLFHIKKKLKYYSLPFEFDRYHSLTNGNNDPPSES